MSDTLNIAGMDKIEVLRALYSAARPLGMGRMHYTPGKAGLIKGAAD